MVSNFSSGDVAGLFGAMASPGQYSGLREIVWIDPKSRFQIGWAAHEGQDYLAVEGNSIFPMPISERELHAVIYRGTEKHLDMALERDQLQALKALKKALGITEPDPDIPVPEGGLERLKAHMDANRAQKEHDARRAAREMFVEVGRTIQDTMEELAGDMQPQRRGSGLVDLLTKCLG